MLAKKHTVITVDLPGHGQSSHSTVLENYRMEAVSDNLLGIMDDLDHHTFDLLGYSMGGRLALYTAVRFPKRIKRLVLESASPGLKTAEERQDRIRTDNMLADRIERDGIESFVNFWESISLWESQAQLSASSKNHLRQLRLTNNEAGLALSLRGMGTGQQPSQWTYLPQLSLPTLLLTGEFDTKFKNIAAEMQTLIPNATHQIIAGAGHTIHLEQPEAWFNTVSTFLSM